MFLNTIDTITANEKGLTFTFLNPPKNLYFIEKESNGTFFLSKEHLKGEFSVVEKLYGLKDITPQQFLDIFGQENILEMIKDKSQNFFYTSAAQLKFDADSKEELIEKAKHIIAIKYSYFNIEGGSYIQEHDKVWTGLFKMNVLNKNPYFSKELMELLVDNLINKTFEENKPKVVIYDTVEHMFIKLDTELKIVCNENKYINGNYIPVNVNFLKTKTIDNDMMKMIYDSHLDKKQYTFHLEDKDGKTMIDDYKTFYLTQVKETLNTLGISFDEKHFEALENKKPEKKQKEKKVKVSTKDFIELG